MLLAPPLQSPVPATTGPFSLLRRWPKSLLRPRSDPTPRLDPETLNDHLRRDLGFTDGRARHPYDPMRD